MSIGYLMASPAAGGLFQKAIIQSSLGREPPHPLEEEEALGVQFAKAAGLEERDADSLRRLDQEAILNAPKPPPAHSLGSFGPILDGNVIAGDPSQAFSIHAERKIPLLIGTNDDDATLSPKIRAQPDLVLGRASIGLPALTELYPESAGSPSDMAAELFTDEVFAEPARHLARSHAASGAPTFRYLFSYVPQEKRQTTGGAGHGDEIQFVFGNLGARSGGSFSAADRDLAEDMMRYWTNFAKTGNPNGKDLPFWPDYRKGNDGTLLVLNDGIKVENNPHGRRLDALYAAKTHPEAGK